MHKFQISFIGLNNLYGQATSLLLKQSPFIKCLKLYDETNIAPALDVASLNTTCKVKAYLGKDQLKHALKESDIIIIGDQCIDNKFSSTAPKLCDYAKSIAQTSPEAIIVIAGEPVNSLLPLMTRIMVEQGCYDSNKVFGATTCDNVRANSLLAQHLKADPKNVVLPVIGGSSQTTRIPVFSQAKPNCSLSEETKIEIINKVKEGDKDIRNYKGCNESLNKAYSLVKFINSIMSGLRGDANVTDIALARTTLVPGVEYFSLPVVLGRSGIVKRYGIPELVREEKEMLKEAIVDLNRDTERARIYLKGSSIIAERAKQDFIVNNKCEESNSFWQPMVKRNSNDSYTIDQPFYKTVNASTLITCSPISCPVSDLNAPKNNNSNEIKHSKLDNNGELETKSITIMEQDNKRAFNKDNQVSKPHVIGTTEIETTAAVKSELETPITISEKPALCKRNYSKYSKKSNLPIKKLTDKPSVQSPKYKISKTKINEGIMKKINIPKKHNQNQGIKKVNTKNKGLTLNTESIDKEDTVKHKKYNRSPIDKVKQFTTQLKKYIDYAEGKLNTENTKKETVLKKIITGKVDILDEKVNECKRLNVTYDKIKKPVIKNDCAEKQEIKSKQGQGDEKILKDVVPLKGSKRKHLKRLKKLRYKGAIDISKKIKTKTEQTAIETTLSQALPEKTQSTEPKDDIEDIIKSYIDSKILSHNIIPLSPKTLIIQRLPEHETILVKEVKEGEKENKSSEPNKSILSSLKANAIGSEFLVDSKDVKTKPKEPLLQNNTKQAILRQNKEIVNRKTENLKKAPISRERKLSIGKSAPVFKINAGETEANKILDKKKEQIAILQNTNPEKVKSSVNSNKSKNICHNLATSQVTERENKTKDKKVSKLTSELSETLQVTERENTTKDKKISKLSLLKAFKEEQEKQKKVQQEVKPKPLSKLSLLKGNQVSTDASKVETEQKGGKQESGNVEVENPNTNSKSENQKEVLLQETKHAPIEPVEENVANETKEVKNKLFMLTTHKRIMDPKSECKEFKKEPENIKIETDIKCDKEDKINVGPKAETEKNQEVSIIKIETKKKTKPKYLRKSYNREQLVRLNFLRNTSLLKKLILQSKQAEQKVKLLKQKVKVMAKVPEPSVYTPKVKVEIETPIKKDAKKIKNIKKMKKLKTLKRPKVPCLLHYLGDKKKTFIHYIVLPEVKTKSKNDGTCADWVRAAVAKGAKFDFDDSQDFFSRGEMIENFEDGRTLNEYNIKDNILPSLKAMKN